MCAGSIAAGIRTTAQIGDRVVVKTFSRGYFRGEQLVVKLFALADDPSCPVCVSFDSIVLFRNLPQDIQRRVGVGAEARAVLISPDVNFHHSRDDLFRIGKYGSVKLSELPDGTMLEVIPAFVEQPVEMPSPEIVEEPELVASS